MMQWWNHRFDDQPLMSNEGWVCCLNSCQLARVLSRVCYLPQSIKPNTQNLNVTWNQHRNSQLMKVPLQNSNMLLFLFMFFFCYIACSVMWFSLLFHIIKYVEVLRFNKGIQEFLDFCGVLLLYVSGYECGQMLFSNSCQ